MVSVSNSDGDGAIADPERALALSYAPAGAREALAALWRLDERLGSIVATARDPTIGAIRLAWWREALEALDRHSPPAEPLLRSVAATLLPQGISGADLAALEEGWATLLTGGPLDEEAIADHGRLRGRPLFTLAARLLGPADGMEPGRAGEGWALMDLARHHATPAEAEIARARAAAILAGSQGFRWPRAHRALGALALLAARDARSDRLERQGSPTRIARLVYHRLTGS